MGGESSYAPARPLDIEHPWISNEAKPVYQWTFPTEATDEELAACIRARDVWVDRVHYVFAWVIDLTNVTKAPATQRKALAEHLKGCEAFSERWNAGSALIVPSPWLRGVVTAVFWISPPKYPTEVFSDAAEAEDWAKRQLELARSG